LLTQRAGHHNKEIKMDIIHWWLIKMVAIQLLALIGIAGCLRYLHQTQTRRGRAKLRKVNPPVAPVARIQGQPIFEN